jgi:arylsulfate sulfotransferase
MAAATGEGQMKTVLRKYFWIACLFLAACGQGGPSDDKPVHLAESAHAAVVEQAPGPTPFIGQLMLELQHFADLSSISYSIAPKPGTFSQPVSVTYDKTWLEREGRHDSAVERFTLPVFGLYADYRNTVTLTFTFRDGSARTERIEMPTTRYSDRAALYSTPDIKTARSAGSAPGFDFMMIQNSNGTPVVLDTDGNLRWVGSGVVDSISSDFTGDAFLVGSQTTPDLYRIKLDGTLTTARLSDPWFTNLHHDISPGRTGYLVEPDALDNGIKKIETILAEVDIDGQVLKQWDMAAIFRRTMQAGGDDPANFVRDGADWFHMNSAFYDASDDSLLVSSRENFVVKLDYESGNIKWIFGDTTKHWFAGYPSLRALALRITSGKTPIGQHSVSITSGGDLLLFNNGYASLGNPPGTAPGQSRPFSTPSRYAVDEQARTAREVWTYERDPPVFSDICSSVYEVSAGKHLVAYAVAAGRTRAKLVGVDMAGTVAFEFEYPTGPCTTAFLAAPVKFEALTIK